MSSSLLITLEMSGVLGVVIVFGLWELWTLRRDKARDQAQDPPGNPAPSTEDTPSGAASDKH